MRRTTLSLLRCPRCGSGPLESESDRDVLRFGPVRCAFCEAVWPLAGSILDLLPAEGTASQPAQPRSLAQRAMESRVVVRMYERGARQALIGSRGQARLDEDSEHLLLRSILAPRPGSPIVDLSCGTGTHAWRLSHQEGLGPIIGIDRSLPMLQEASHHLVEAGADVDLIRADAERLPILSGKVGSVLNVGAFHLYREAPTVLREIWRILEPGGNLTCATLLPERLGALDRVAGIQRRDEAELRRLCEAAGLVEFERLLLPPWIIFRVQKR